MNEKLAQKYGEQAIETGRRLQPSSFDRRLQLRDSLDQHFTRLWLDFGMTGLSQRRVLDERTRLLVPIGQFAMTHSERFLEEAIQAALAGKVAPREVLEVILQCVVYGGNVVLDPALDVFVRVAEEMGALEEIRKSQMPLDGRDGTRSLDEERGRWHEDDRNDPRQEDLMARHGWLGVSTGMITRPREHLNVLAYLDKLDADFATMWERYTYQGMYGRGILDDKTRILCIIGNCVAIGEGIQIRAHIRSALHVGAEPREILEVILQSCIHFGMPPTMQALATLYRVMDDLGRLDEIGNPAFPQREWTR